MMTDPKNCDLIVVGSGTAGTAAALFAAERGVSVALIGSTSGMRFSSGMVDLMAVCPQEQGRTWENPWDAIRQLAHDADLRHPYTRIDPADIRRAMAEYFAWLADNGLPYQVDPDHNQSMLTAAGTLKSTYGLPQGMAAGARAVQQELPCLLVGFPELKGFSAHQIREVRGKEWTNLRSIEIPFPGSYPELLAEQMAKALEEETTRTLLADQIRPHRKDASAVGLPAVLGIENHPLVHADLEQKLGASVFEIPTMPPSIPGLRLKNIFEKRLREKGVFPFFQQRAEKVVVQDNGLFQVHVGAEGGQKKVCAKGLILSTGRFFSQGLRADREGIREPLLNLPVVQPDDRSCWHRKDFFSAAGHRINRAGLAVDDHFRPLTREGRPVHSSLFAIGSILAHQDWMRMKCGTGLSISTALAAVEAFCRQRATSDV